MAATLIKTNINKTILTPLCEKSICKLLTSQGVNDIGKIHIFSSIPSTNDYLFNREIASKQIEVCLAEQQTCGKGRYGHQWVSPSGVNLYLSILFPPVATNKQFDLLGLWLLLSIANLLEKYGLTNIKLKWPNDICIENKKLGGVLIERKVSQSNDNLVVGVGLNVAMSTKKNVKIGSPWTDLISTKLDWNISRNELAANVIAVFYETKSNFEQNQLNNLAEKWSVYDFLKNKKVEFKHDNDIKSGYVKGIDYKGHIIIDWLGENLTFHSSHISEIRVIEDSV